MAHINLLPWREEKRAAKQKRFVTGMVAAVVVAALAVGGVWYGYSSTIDHQISRNDRLRAEIFELDKKIKEIRELEKLKSQLIARMEVVENLQASRSAPVHFFNEIARTLPEGVHLGSVAMNGQSLTIAGEAQSNARVSSYMRALEASPWFDSPELVVIKTQTKGAVRTSNFTLRVKQVIEQQPEGEAAS
ncbi:MAG: PilN domain-containing protein [Gammaproteobacteria bacterium]|nr:PilN domain-containing protein [Gammaproteobacteria bacterium]